MDTPIPQQTKTAAIVKFGNKFKLVPYKENMDRVTRFVYLGDFSILENISLYYERILQTKHGVFVFLKKQHRLLTLCENTGANFKNMLFFEDSSLKTNGIISLLTAFETTEKISEKPLTIIQTILTDLHNHTLQEIIAVAYQHKDLKKIQYIYENSEALERFERIRG